MVTTALREKMRAILRARNYSHRTEETYIDAVVHYARHFGTPPDQLGSEHVVACQIWLRDQKHASHVRFNRMRVAFLLRPGAGEARCGRAHSLRTARASIAGRSVDQRDHRVSQFHRHSSLPRATDDDLCDRPSVERGARGVRECAGRTRANAQRACGRALSRARRTAACVAAAGRHSQRACVPSSNTT